MKCPASVNLQRQKADSWMPKAEWTEKKLEVGGLLMRTGAPFWGEEHGSCTIL